ncbi:hypothetical protein LWI29_020301 [Acer saccharum]|uniref:Uncharacterized protein n=1 Tax=Acer saccharum TaxID=4024 RepID=A0AA39SM91_ACESA|nr:hypothetical protein LWI29_020301 [Acer saccharum]
MCNQLTGFIPDKLGELIKLEVLGLWKNSFTGSLPRKLGQNSPLQWFDVSSNSLSDEIPPGLCDSGNLIKLILFNNSFSGTLPMNLSTSSHNNFQGKIPNQFQDHPSLSVLDLSSNRLSGEIPESIASCEKLVTLNLRNNQLTGAIPRAIAKMPTLAILDLSSNSLAGKIPENFGTSPTLEMLNMSFNKLEGPVPSNGILMTINPNELIGNVGLCGGVLPPCPQKYTIKPGHPRNLNINHVIIGFVVRTLVIVFLGIAIFTGKLLYKRWYLYNSFFDNLFRKSYKEWPWRLIAFQRLNFTSTDILACVKESNIIGMGGTGIVYKAEVNRPHVVVAVKKLWRSESDIETGDDLIGEVSLL